MKTKSLRFTKQAIIERELYHLNESLAYKDAVNRYYQSAKDRSLRWGHWADSSTATKNMIRALRMLPALNSADDWGRLHVAEAALSMPR